ncbi:hypothetical protein BaRGS_00021259 [Batillaria attramentaria]|uniref:Uncharacterized protein n=1 Tax=Batillaria attramentaria TaxID=370345 RepID=A0ABD0KKP9_9CAEN
MRGSKGGLEALVRKRKAPHLLDIDGDSCHHAHNAAKRFCAPFLHHVEGLLSDVYTDFKWSVEQKERLFDICLVLNIKPSTPERYVPHRWLSVLDVSLDTLRLLDAYTLYYSSFLREKDQSVYEEVVEEILARCQVSEKGRKEIKKIQAGLRKKWSTFTKEGKDRKLRVIESVLPEDQDLSHSALICKGSSRSEKLCAVLSKQSAIDTPSPQQTK